jgi:hypothetical protein
LDFDFREVLATGFSNSDIVPHGDGNGSKQKCEMLLRSIVQKKTENSNRGRLELSCSDNSLEIVEVPGKSGQYGSPTLILDSYH